MSEQKQLFSASLAKDARYKTGLRRFMEYRDLGIENATHGRFRAHVIRIKKDAGSHELECSDDVEILEIYAPAIHETVVIDKMPSAAAAH